jgi:HSP20 family protein
VFERGGSLVVRADLPGLDRNDVRVRVDDDSITIEGERRAEHEEKREGYYHSERSYGSFARTVPLPRGADRSTCEAVFENGVLEVTMKLPQATTRHVQIRGGTTQAQPLTQASTSPEPATTGGTTQSQAAPQRQVQNGPPSVRH